MPFNIISTHNITIIRLRRVSNPYRPMPTRISETYNVFVNVKVIIV